MGSPKKSSGKGNNKNLLWILGAIVIVVVVGWSMMENDQPDSDLDLSSPEAVALGAELYQKNCTPCHGLNGEGERPEKPNGGQKNGGGYLAPALNGKGHTWHHSPDVLLQIVRDGSVADDSAMVGWKGRMSDNEIRSVLAHIRINWPEDLQKKYAEAFGL